VFFGLAYLTVSREVMAGNGRVICCDDLTDPLLGLLAAA
jgi:hypothetical protein